jgi:hypothetical protein
VPGDATTDLDLGRTRTVVEIFSDSLWLCRRAPLLFIVLSAVVVVPYRVAVVIVEHGKGGLSVSAELILVLVGVAFIEPCIATFQVQALLALGDGQRPAPRGVIRGGLAVLPAVAAAVIISGLGIALGLFCFLIPGVLLAMRWAVVAQTAAVERVDWPTALRRSGHLTRGNYWRILGLLAAVALLNEIPADIIGSGNHVASVIIGIIVAIATQSFATLALCLLYFDLRAREAARAPQAEWYQS